MTKLRHFGFKLSISRMLESSGVETFSLLMQHPDAGEATLLNGKVGLIHICSDTDIDKIRYFAAEHALALGIPVNEIQDSFIESHPEEESMRLFREDMIEEMLEA